MWWETPVYPKNGEWTHFAVRLTDANFAAVGGTFADILQNVTALKILGDIVYSTGTIDTTGLDNVRVSAPTVSLPGIFLLLE